MNPVTTNRDPETLRREWAELRTDRPRIRIRNAAAELGVSEAELLATRVGDGVRPIETDVSALLPRLEELGELMALTRNHLFVHEKIGVYRNVSVGAHAAQVVDENIDLRIFPASWIHGFAVESEARRGLRRSLQLFDAHGVAVHKIFLRDESDLDAYERLVDDLAVDEASWRLALEPPAESEEPRPDVDVDVEALEAGWRGMKDTHDFFHLLRRLDVQRTQALRLVPDELAHPVDNGRLRHVLEGASAEEIDLMVFVRSPGTFQIHHGPVSRIVDHEEWLNVLDPTFNLHVREGGIAGSWVVRKPTETGWVTSLELYDGDDELCALVFGCREEGEPESERWRALVERV